MNDATKDVVAANRHSPLWLAAGHRREELEPSMWSGRAVGPDVLGDHRLQMTAGDDEEMIKAVLSNGPHTLCGTTWSTARGAPVRNRGSA
jgi:hypothetical protein